MKHLALLALPFALLACKSTPAAAPAPQTGKTVALWNGHDLANWHVDVPEADHNPGIRPSFVVRNGLLVSMGEPQGHLITNASYANYKLVVEYRWPGKTGNCGVLAHASTPRRLYGMFPQSIECQMNFGNAGDFWCIGEDIRVPDEEKRRHAPPAKWGGEAHQARRIQHLGNFENPAGEWNRMEIECRGREIIIHENGQLANHGHDCTADHGQIALQAEGAECEFRKVELTPLAN